MRAYLRRCIAFALPVCAFCTLSTVDGTSMELATSAGPMFLDGVRHEVTADAAADLIVSSLTDPPKKVLLGGRFTSTDIVKNQGDLPAAASVTRYYLSQTTARDGSEILLTGSRSIPAIKVGKSSKGKKTLTVPATVPLTITGGSPGPYYLIACANDTGSAAESNPSNNCRPSAGTVSVFAPDLVVTAVGDPPSALASGSRFTVTNTVQNQGSATVGGSVTRYYLSTSQAREVSSVLLAGSRTVPSLKPGAESHQTVSVTVPPGMPLGSYYLLACADDKGKSMEGSEANNCLASAAQATVSTFKKADLQGVWQMNALSSGPEAPWWERGPVTVRANGSFSFNFQEYPNGKPDRGAGVFSISSDGIVKMERIDPNFQAAMNSDKTVVAGTTTWDDSAHTSNMAIMTKKGSTYSLADLEGTWEVNALASGSNPHWERGSITFVDANGGYSGTLDKSGGGSRAVSGTFAINNGGIMQRVPATDSVSCGMDARKTIVTCTETWTDGGPSSVLSVWTRKGDSYISDDLTGVWEVNSMASGAGAPWWERGPLTVNQDGTFTGTYQQSDGTPDNVSGTMSIADDIVQIGPDDENRQCTMDSSKTVIVCTSTWAGDGTAELTVVVKKGELQGLGH